MADIPRYAIAIPQNLAATGVEFTQKELTITRGCLLSASKDTNREVALLAVGTEGQVLTVDASGDLAWTTLGAGHTQNTDTGTTSNTFEVSSDGTAGSLILSGASAGGDFSTTIINTTQSGDIVLTLPAVTGTLATEAYAAGLFAANDAMLYKGTIGSGGTHEIAAFNALTTYNAGWTYRVIEAGTIRGVVCQVGDLVTVSVRVALGSTSSVTGAIYVSVPISATMDYEYCGQATFWNLGGAQGLFPGIVWAIEPGRFICQAISASGSYGKAEDTSATIPFTWQTGNYFRAYFSYKVG